MQIKDDRLFRQFPYVKALLLGNDLSKSAAHRNIDINHGILGIPRSIDRKVVEIRDCRIRNHNGGILRSKQFRLILQVTDHSIHRVIYGRLRLEGRIEGDFIEFIKMERPQTHTLIMGFEVFPDILLILFFILIRSYDVVSGLCSG